MPEFPQNRRCRDIHAIRLVRPDTPEYRDYGRRMRVARPSCGGPRARGEVLGGTVERVVRHWLGQQVPLMDERILTWKEKRREVARYRELDAVWQAGDDTLCLFEIKLTTEERMLRGTGLRQLREAAQTILCGRRWRQVRQRVVYITAAGPLLAVRGGEIASVEAGDAEAETGVVWVCPEAVETAAAAAMGESLPENWMQPESRRGVVEEDPARDGWRQYADTAARGEPFRDSPGPVAAALERALKLSDAGSAATRLL